MPLTRIKSTAIGDNTITDSKITGGGIAPTGTILPYSSETAPTGWFICDGRTVSRTTYSDLFAVLSTNWGYGDNSTTFNIPDLRGRFLRGHDDGNGNDPDAASRTASNTGGATGDNVGSVQGNSTSRPNSSFSGGTSISGSTGGAGGHAHSYYFSNGSTPGSYPVGLQGSDRSASTSYVGNHSHTISLSTTTTINSGGDNETRPINANVNYIIKY